MAAAESSTTSLGSYLRGLRESKGGSLEDMARSTRVGLRHLEALEAERLADLPSPVFVRGFIRAYCTFLRENPDEALGRYEALSGERAAAKAASEPPSQRTTWASSSVLVGLALLAILGIALVIINLTVKRQGGTSVAAPNIERSPAPAAAPAIPSPAPAPVPAAPSPVAAPAQPPPPATAATEAPRPPTPLPASAPTPAASTPTAPAVPAVPSAPAAVQAPPPAAATAKAASRAQRLVIRANEATWIRVQPDDGRATEETLPPGASREWSAERRFLLTIGNAGGVEVTLNGTSLPPLGPKGAVIYRLELPQPPASGS
jgi:cytoskeleton protein RodZ